MIDKPKITQIKNLALDVDKEWVDEKGRKFTEVIRQEYTGNSCVFSGGVVEGSKVPEDKYYLKWERAGEDSTMVLMRRDEIIAVNWICAGIMWTDSLETEEGK